MTWLERKEARRDYFNRFVFGWRLRACVACAGSGRYDSDKSPLCSGCDGQGRERYRSHIAAPAGEGKAS